MGDGVFRLPEGRDVDLAGIVGILRALRDAEPAATAARGHPVITFTHGLDETFEILVGHLGIGLAHARAAIGMDDQ